MEGFSFVTPVTGLNRPNTGKEDDDDDDVLVNNYAAYKRIMEIRVLTSCGLACPR
jgi:hypothetical protein